MILFANILYALAKLVELTSGLLTIYKYILIATALISWVNPTRTTRSSTFCTGLPTAA